MTKLVLSAANSELLRQLAQQNASQHSAVVSLKHALEAQPDQPKMTAQSPAVPSSTSSADASSHTVVLDHTVLLSVAAWAQKNGDATGDTTKLKLSSLVAGSHVYLPPKPVFQRSAQLEASLTAIRRAQEAAEYQRMSSTATNLASSYKIPSSYVNIAGVDPTLSLAQRIASHTQSPIATPTRTQLGTAEEQAWKDAQHTLSVILNIVLSTLATATAAWWASGNASAPRKLLVSMLVALITALAEVVLYNRYSVYVKQSKQIKHDRMQGSDLTRDQHEFKPLQLDKRTAPQSRKTATAKAIQKDPS